jgi:hypothetical protein
MARAHHGLQLALSERSKGRHRLKDIKYWLVKIFGRLGESNKCWTDIEAHNYDTQDKNRRLQDTAEISADLILLWLAIITHFRSYSSGNLNFFN